MQIKDVKMFHVKQKTGAAFCSACFFVPFPLRSQCAIKAFPLRGRWLPEGQTDEVFEGTLV